MVGITREEGCKVGSICIPSLRKESNIRRNSVEQALNFLPKHVENGLPGRFSGFTSGVGADTISVVTCRKTPAERLPWGCKFWSLQKGDNMKLRHLAAIAVLLTLGCQSGDTSTPTVDTPAAADTPTAADTPAAADTSDATTSIDSATEDKLMKVSLNVTGMK